MLRPEVGGRSGGSLLYLTLTHPYGAADTFLRPEVAELRRLGTEVNVVPVRPHGEPGTTFPADVDWIRPVVDWTILLAFLRAVLTRPRRLVRTLRILMEDLRSLPRNLLVVPKALWIAQVAQDTRARHIHAHWLAVPATAALIASEMTGIPWSVTGHRADIIADNLLVPKSRSADFVRFISHAGAELARRCRPGIDESRWLVLHLGVELPEPVTPRPDVNRPPVILCVGHFVPDKDHQALLDVYGRLVRRGSDAELWLVGQGPTEPEIRERVRSSKWQQRVRILGYLEHREVIELYRRGEVDVVVLASSIEGIPVALMEAMASSVPAAAYDVGGMSELLGDGCGVMVAPGDVTELAEGIERLLIDPDYRLDIARLGRMRVESDFDVHGTAADLKRLVEAGPGL